MMGQNEIQENTILYGIPKVAHGAYGSQTPFPICVKAISEYLGDDISYPYIMTATGAAFRLVWNTKEWDLSNVDYYHTFEESNEVYEWGGRVLGREFDYLERDEETTQEEFAAFIRGHLAEGYPCIALGVIGPPEPCIITGYRENGKYLLGWNFFQDDPQFVQDIQKEDNGYFLSGQWWNNTDTQAVMCLGPVVGEMMSEKEVLRNAIAALQGRVESGYAKGILAYDAWRQMLLDEGAFPKNIVYDDLFTRLLAHNDILQCLSDGRSHGAMYMRELAQSHDGNEKRQLLEVAGHLERVSKYAGEMKGLVGDWSDTDGMLKRLADRAVREQTGELIMQAKEADEKALQGMRQIFQNC